jgi:hypothetical protein
VSRNSRLYSCPPAVHSSHFPSFQEFSAVNRQAQGTSTASPSWHLKPTSLPPPTHISANLKHEYKASIPFSVDPAATSIGQLDTVPSAAHVNIRPHPQPSIIDASDSRGQFSGVEYPHFVLRNGHVVLLPPTLRRHWLSSSPLPKRTAPARDVR